MGTRRTVAYLIATVAAKNELDRNVKDPGVNLPFAICQPAAVTML